MRFSSQNPEYKYGRSRAGITPADALHALHTVEVVLTFWLGIGRSWGGENPMYPQHKLGALNNNRTSWKS